ncbi:MAG TPA: aminotransferase class IV [Nitrospiria bacterium]|nr:aminotransferase class IV [Nitrospiria bacterium]
MTGKANGGWIHFNGRLIPEREALISVYDRGFLYGDGVFETLRAYDAKVFRSREHVSRLFRSAQAISLSISSSPDEILKILSQTLEANRLRNAYLRITVSRGPGEIGLEPGDSSSPTIVIMAKEFFGHPEKLYREGVGIAVVKARKTPASSLDPKIKSLNYLTPILAKIEARASGVYEGILLNQEGYLCEGTVSNLFLVRKGQLLTPAPSCGILEGITRQAVIELANKAGIIVKEGKYRPDEILRADECFLTNTTMELMPAVRITGVPATQVSQPIGEGRVGPLTRFLHQAYQEEVLRD